MNYRNLNISEIDILQKQGCHSEDWTNIKVSENFTTTNILNVRFCGQVKIGNITGSIQIKDGISKSCGLYYSYIQNCTIGNNVYISEVKNMINYHIEDHVAIENVGTLTVSGETTFGNGTEIEILNEGGGRELPIYDKLTSQVAYMLVSYRHDNKLIKKLNNIIRTYVEEKKSSYGIIRENARIVNSNTIQNVNVGNAATISGVSLLQEGTIGSCKEAPTMIGEGVTAKNFIILSGSNVDGGAIIEKTFVGQSVKIGKQFSSENSAFFANSEGFHGEACSIYAGPYTVTHHKSTLLIAGMFSFYNAGSGTNQSNHMYKLGPLHQGILDRGSKTGSFSYMMWPCRVGAFTAVIGKHKSNFDATELPFSYITEEDGKSYLTPAMNLLTVGTRRDSEKWPARDKRKDPEKLDLINFDLFNPYIIGKVEKGIRVLNELHENSVKDQENVQYKGIRIKRLMLKTCRKYYEMAVSIYAGDEIIKQLERTIENSKVILRDLFKPTETKQEDWIDLSGMITSKDAINSLIKKISEDDIKTVTQLNENLNDIFEDYNSSNWNWCINFINRFYQLNLVNASKEDLVKIIDKWKVNKIKLNNMILKDAEKEFNETCMIGFGIDGDEDTVISDFEAVRGSFYSNKFVKELITESKEIEDRTEKIIKLIDSNL